MDASCPWQNFSQENLYFCEQQVCGWVRQPADAWSNLALVIAGIIILYLTFRRREKYLSLLGWISIFVGVGSFLFHATATYWGGLVDAMSMYFVVWFALVTNFWRVFGWWKWTRILVFSAGVILAIGLTMTDTSRTIVLFAMPIFLALGLEFFLEKRGLPFWRDLNFWGIITTFLVAFLIWNLDVMRIVCDPTNHVFQGHALWHILSAIAVLFLYRYFSQFKMPEWGSRR